MLPRPPQFANVYLGVVPLDILQSPQVVLKVAPGLLLMLVVTMLYRILIIPEILTVAPPIVDILLTLSAFTFVAAMWAWSKKMASFFAQTQILC